MIYPTYMNMNALVAEPSVMPYPLIQTPEFLFDSSPLYHAHPHGTLGLTPSPLLPVEPIQRAPASRLGKRGSLDSSASDMGSMHIDDTVRSATPPTKRSRREPLPSGRVPGACTRCKRLKVNSHCASIPVPHLRLIASQMKCTFADNDTTCARCIVGGHECVVLGRKPRSPG